MCWEDADVLIAGLAPAGKKCLSIGSAGDNSFSLLAAGAEFVACVEMSVAQVACIELRKAAYLCLEHAEMLELLGINEATAARRRAYYLRCAVCIDEASRQWFNQRMNLLETGLVHQGRFENYFRLFRKWVLPIAHSKKKISHLLWPSARAERDLFYRDQWDNKRWRALFRLFFSRTMMGRLGRDPAFFAYVEGSVAEQIMKRVKHALTALDPSVNPYLYWILQGKFGKHLPHALRLENYALIRDALRAGRMSIHCCSLEGLLNQHPDLSFDAFNLSDIFEYMSEETAAGVFAVLWSHASSGARLAYWNMLAPRSHPADMNDCFFTHRELSEKLFLVDKAFFYSRFIVEEVRK
jgi:S-adenosylmethionine-diacylglycerol 3-amino-3-carboxypropyl transferase